MIEVPDEVLASMVGTNTLDNLSKEIKRECDESRLRSYVALGEMLIQAKRKLPHGQFYAWIKANFKFSTMTAYRYMKLAKEEDYDFGD